MYKTLTRLIHNLRRADPRLSYGAVPSAGLFDGEDPGIYIWPVLHFVALSRRTYFDMGGGVGDYLQATIKTYVIELLWLRYFVAASVSWCCLGRAETWRAPLKTKGRRPLQTDEQRVGGPLDAGLA